MDKEYVYEENDSEGLTFKKIGAFFKRGWLIILITILACAVIATAIALPVKILYKSEPIGKTAIEYVYDGADRGLAPDGGMLDTDNIISISVLGKAVKAAGLEKKIKNISEFRDACRVEGVYGKEYIELTEAAANGDKNAQAQLRDNVYYPTQYNIVISTDELDLKDGEITKLLDKIVSCYFDDFQKRFAPRTVFDADRFALTENGNYEFTYIYDRYISELAPIGEYLTALKEKAPAYVSASAGKTFGSLIANYDSIVYELNRFENNVVNNNIWVNKATAKTELQSDIKDITDRIANLEQDIERLKTQIKDYAPNSTTTTSPDGGQTVSTSYGAEYTRLQLTLAQKNDTLLEMNNELSAYENRLSKIEGDTPTDAAQIDAARNSLKAIETTITDFVDGANAMTYDYYSSTNVVGAIRRTQPATVTRITNGFELWVVYLVAVLGGFIIGCVINGVLIVRRSKKNDGKLADGCAKKDTAASDTEDK